MLIVGERVNREITNFHLLCWRAAKVVKVVVCTRKRILPSLEHCISLKNRHMSQMVFLNFTEIQEHCISLKNRHMSHTVFLNFT